MQPAAAHARRQPAVRPLPDPREDAMTEVTTWGEALFLSLSNALNSFLNAIPQVIGALLIIIIGWVISNVLARIVREVLERAGADRVFAEHSKPVYGTRSNAFQPSVVASEVVKWIVRFFFLVAAANVLGMPQVSELLNQVLLWIPNLIVAALILLLAPLLARFVRGAIEVERGPDGLHERAASGADGRDRHRLVRRPRRDQPARHRRGPDQHPVHRHRGLIGARVRSGLRARRARRGRAGHAGLLRRHEQRYGEGDRGGQCGR